MYEEDPTPAEQATDFAAALRAAITTRSETLTWLRERLAAGGNLVSVMTLS